MSQVAAILRGVSSPSDSTERDAVAAWQRWHAARVRSLQAPDGWLSLTGLHFLDDGVWGVGSSPASRIHAPGASAPCIGSFVVDGDRVTFTRDLQPDGTASKVTVDGKDVDAAELLPDDRGGPSFVRDGDLSFALVRRNGRLALRVRDNRSELRARFEGFPLYPYNPRLVVEARAIPAPAGELIDITNVTGFIERQPLAATISFELPGPSGPVSCSLVATAGSGASLFVVFGDATNGCGTYAGGRFLSLDAPDPAGRVSLDFNLAHNPVCAFVPYATCPMPPSTNRIPLPIEAGERYPHTTRSHP